MTPSWEALVAPLVALCREAGDAIEAARRGGVETRWKADESPVTAADLAAHRVLIQGLPALGEAWPILSEESAAIPWETRHRWTTYWLVDPLDGTKEFLRGSDEYTVNVALVHRQRSILGVIVKAATAEVWVGEPERGAWYQASAGADWRALRVRAATPPRLVVSRFHRGRHTQALIEALDGASVEPLGSSLKCCRIAAGEADLYPRFGPTSEWDTAAAQAVLEGAGGSLVDMRTWRPLRYNTRETLLNPPFVACASLSAEWRLQLPIPDQP
ncbi:3'(2'),5'-bisphosphate nucleotidase CysQ [Salinicola avicenniae]|uniref:3'(2'),5'-bisphosphate nucleotidase CysQ n=1 Tax=Salinicola avicenniae TaxID=2916836 RepID=UPI0020732C77|nr:MULTISPECIES: 3'(2'),5'-bisphosphate nucleotidase CysQ [unclassified Salinicola]